MKIFYSTKLLLNIFILQQNISSKLIILTLNNNIFVKHLLNQKLFILKVPFDTLQKHKTVNLI